MSELPTPEHPEPFDQQGDLALLGLLEAELTGVEQALRRLDGGAYGFCEVCGTALDGADLERSPLLVRCPDHA